MKEYRVSELSGNETLAKAVYLENGQILLEPGIVLKSTYKESLMSLNIQKVYIEDIFEKYENPNYYITKEHEERYREELREIISYHIYKENRGLKKILPLAESLTDEIIQAEENRVLDIKDQVSDIYEHMVLTTVLMLVVAKKCKLPRDKMFQIAVGGLFHDLGFRYISVDYRECSRKKMTASEIYELKKHTILAYTALEEEEWISDISRNMILSHHEKLDGSGYPLKQRNQEMECRLIQICDTFESAVSGMESEKKNVGQALEQISDGTKYDQSLVEVLRKSVGRYPVGTFMTKEDGKRVFVIEQTENPYEPNVLYTEKIEKQNI